MAWPAGYAQVEVHGGWFDPFNNPHSGWVTFEPTETIYDAFGEKIIPPAITGIKLVDGEFTTSLLATDEPNITPKGWLYKVSVAVPGGGSFLLAVSKDISYLDISTYLASGTVPPDQLIPTTYATIEALAGERSERIAEDDNLQAQISAIVEDKYHLHDQSTASASWVVAHNFGRFPNVTILDFANEQVEADVVHSSVNEVSITFSSPLSGKAVCS